LSSFNLFKTDFEDAIFGLFVVYLFKFWGVASGSLPCVGHVPECCGTQVLKVETNSEGCQEFSCDCERKCPKYFEPVCDDGGRLHDNWCKFGIEACKLEESVQVLKISPMSHCPEMSFGPNHCFHFDESDTRAHVVLHPLNNHPISEFMVDFTLHFSKLTTDPYFLSYAVPGTGKDNEFVISLNNLWIGSVRVTTYPVQTVSVGEYRRFTMSVKDGKIFIYWDGEIFAKLQTQRRTLRSGGIWLLAQDQDTFGGKFDANQRFVGNFRMWNHGLNENELAEFFVNPNTTGSNMVFDNPPTYEYEKRNGAH